MSKRDDEITTTIKEGEQATGENYDLLKTKNRGEKKEGMVKEELREGVE